MTEEPPEGGEHEGREVSLAELGIGVSPASEGTRLRAVPGDSAPTRRAPVAEWAVTLVEPLIATTRRAECDAAFARYVAAHPRWSSFWFAGLLGDLLKSLPDDDPWLRLSATLDLSLISAGHPSEDGSTVLTHVAPGGSDAPAETGAVFDDGRRFGASTDVEDLVKPEMLDRRADPGLAGAADDLGPVPAAVLGLAGGELEEFAAALREIYHHLRLARFPDIEGEPMGRIFLEAVVPALRRLAHRRSAYMPEARDLYPAYAAYHWMSHADRLDAGLPLEKGAGLAEDAALPSGEYGFLTHRSR